jgi:GNAT superfamily N-acetyltransferase
LIKPVMHMASSYEITSARAQDVHFLPAIELAAARLLEGHLPAAALNETTSVQELREAQVQGRLWVALACDTPVGFAHVEFLGPHEVHLKEIDVDPAHGRQGLGARLVNTVCQWAAARSYPAMTLTTFRDVPWNMPFYLHQKFEVVPADDLSAALMSILKEEASRGLDPARRVAMRRLLSPPSDSPRRS